MKFISLMQISIDTIKFIKIKVKELMKYELTHYKNIKFELFIIKV
jgi:hypothetical protein